MAAAINIITIACLLFLDKKKQKANIKAEDRKDFSLRSK